MSVVSNDIYKSHQQSSRTVYARISLLNSQNLKIGELTGQVIDGTWNSNSRSAVRNTCDLSLVVSDNSLIPSVDGKISLGNRFRLEIGIVSFLDGLVKYNDKGIYVIDAPSLAYSLTTKTLSIKGLDLMCLLDGTRGGNLESKVTIEKGFNISDVIKTAVQQYSGFTTVNIEKIDYTVPYLIEVDTTVYALLAKLRDLYYGYEFFFDSDGVFVFRTIQDRITDPIHYNFAEDKNLITDYQVDLDYQNIRNRIVVWGKLMTDGSQVKSVLTNTDANSPWNVNRKGEITLTIKSDAIMTQEQADTRCEFEIKKHGIMNDKIVISCIPIYYLNSYDVIYVNVPELKLIGKYVIDTISTPLKFDGKQSISAYILSYEVTNYEPA